VTEGIGQGTHEVSSLVFVPTWTHSTKFIHHMRYSQLLFS